MPRDANGNYTLPSGNPVVSGEVISSTWANPTMGDLANAMTDSLSRSGQGGMLVPFKFVDGDSSAPAMAFTTEPSLGIYRAGASDLRMTSSGVPKLRITGVGVDIWNSNNSTWNALSNAAGLNIPLLNVANVFTDTQKVVLPAASWVLFDLPTPAFGARFGLSSFAANQVDLSYYSAVTAGWNPILLGVPNLSTGVLEQTRFRGERISFDSSGGVEFGNVATAGFSALQGRYFRGLDASGTKSITIRHDGNNALIDVSGGVVILGNPSGAQFPLVQFGGAVYYNAEASYPCGQTKISSSAPSGNDPTRAGEVWYQIA